MKTSSGSALLMVLCLSTVLMIATTTSWYTASLLHEVACVRQQRFQQQQSAQALLLYGILIAQHKFDDLCKESEPIVLYQGAWPLSEDLIGNGYVISRHKKDGVALVATLEAEVKEPLHARQAQQTTNAAALLRHDKQDQKKIIIAQWGMFEES
ncbi:hypothetical protein JST99_00125 [Candidatus Dependentiae bacterium]|nr:hypothetical protein [Candidatus Dependentiae bacterium]MCC7414594.1 hypothetical protein [Campylobacterota bacterium]